MSIMPQLIIVYITSNGHAIQCSVCNTSMSHVNDTIIGLHIICHFSSSAMLTSPAWSLSCKSLAKVQAFAFIGPAPWKHLPPLTHSSSLTDETRAFQVPFILPWVYLTRSTSHS